MKPIWMIAIVAASLAAGGAGGFAAMELNKTPAPVVGQVKTDSDHRPDHSADAASKDDVGALSRRLNDLQVRLEQAEKKAAENTRLQSEIEASNKRIADLEKNRSSGTVDSGTSSGGAATGDTGAVRAQVRAELEAIEQEKQKAEQDRREKQAQEWAAAQNKAIVDRLVKDLNLTTDQQSKVEAIVTDYQTKQRELWTRAGQARESGQEFDWRAEGQKVETAAQESIRAELLGGQLETFNSLVSERGLNSLGGRGFGMGMGGQGGGQGGRQAGGRGGRGGND